MMSEEAKGRKAPRPRNRPEVHERRAKLKKFVNLAIPVRIVARYRVTDHYRSTSSTRGTVWATFYYIDAWGCYAAHYLNRDVDRWTYDVVDGSTSPGVDTNIWEICGIGAAREGDSCITGREPKGKRIVTSHQQTLTCPGCPEVRDAVVADIAARELSMLPRGVVLIIGDYTKPLEVVNWSLETPKEIYYCGEYDAKWNALNKRLRHWGPCLKGQELQWDRKISGLGATSLLPITKGNRCECEECSRPWRPRESFMECMGCNYWLLCCFTCERCPGCKSAGCPCCNWCRNCEWCKSLKCE